jgi:hypothetical protein
MAAYNLTGSGVQALTAGTVRLFVEVTTAAQTSGFGKANPLNYYHLGLLRAGVTGFFAAPVPIEGLNTFMDLPSGTDSLGYSLEGGTAITVSEGATPPPPPGGGVFFGPSDTPNATYVWTADSSYGNGFFMNGLSATMTGFRYYRPSASDGITAVHFHLWRQQTGTVERDFGTQPISVGWNTFSITPYTWADHDLRVIWADFPAGIETPAGVGQWSGEQVGEFYQGDTYYYGGTGFGTPDTHDFNPIWAGIDPVAS